MKVEKNPLCYLRCTDKDHQQYVMWYHNQEVIKCSATPEVSDAARP